MALFHFSGNRVNQALTGPEPTIHMSFAFTQATRESASLRGCQS